MKIGFIISMYDEIDIVQNTVDILKQNKSPIIVIQSDPQQPEKLLEQNQVNFYQKLSDLAGSKEEYLEERDVHNAKEATTPVKAITRNVKAGFAASQNFDVEWWVVILGDILISNLQGITKIIQEMIEENKLIGITRAVGQVFRDTNSELTRIQKDDTTDFMPQFFIVNSSLIKKGLFSKFHITNLYTSEQCLGDEVVRYCVENNINFKNLTYIISDYAYPQFISGLKYNPDRVRMPKRVDGFVNMLRRVKTKYYSQSNAMLSFEPKKNMSFGEYLLSYARYYYFLFQSFNRYRKTFKNYLDVIRKFRRNESPIKCVMRNGDIKTLNKFQIILFTRNVGKYCKFNKEVLSIKIRDLPEIKMADWEDNGDFFSTVLYDDEYQSMQIENKEIIDIGANNGDTSIYYAMRGANSVIALEPIPTNYESAKKNIELNGLSNIINIIMAGCGGTKGEVKIASDIKGVGYSANNSVLGKPVPIITLNDILKISKSDDRILKLDCEGCEYETILSAPKEILQKFDQIRVSYHYGYKNLVKKLKNSGFEVSYMKPRYFPRVFYNDFTEQPKMFIGDINANKII